MRKITITLPNPADSHKPMGLSHETSATFHSFMLACYGLLIYIYIVCFASLQFHGGLLILFLAHTKEWALHLGGFNFWGFAKVFSLGATGRLVVFVGILAVFVWFWLWLGSLCRQCPLFLFCLRFATVCFLLALSLSLKVVSARLVAATITTTTATATTSMTKTTRATSLFLNLYKYRLH